MVPLLQRVIAVENRNSALNEFVASLFKRLQEAGVQVVRVEREYLISDEGQLSTRAQALVERLRAKAMR